MDLSFVMGEAPPNEESSVVFLSAEVSPGHDDEHIEHVDHDRDYEDKTEEQPFVLTPKTIIKKFHIPLESQ